ncbi:MAG: hypothetical protein ACO3A2_02445 [Bdellovibrionia bacterium]
MSVRFNVYPVYIHLSNSRGALHFPLLAVFMLLTLGGLGTLGFLRHWRFLVETQFRMDRCVGQAAQSLRDSLNTLESANREIGWIRKALVLAQANPELIPPLQVALQAEVVRQEVILGAWSLRKLRWSLPLSCGSILDRAWPLPDLNFHRPPADLIGLQALKWSGAMPQAFELKMTHSPRRAQATVEKGGGARDLGQKTEGGPIIVNSQATGLWQAHWGSARSQSRSDFY